jgi:pilus assembly protein CpaE
MEPEGGAPGRAHESTAGGAQAAPIPDGVLDTLRRSIPAEVAAGLSEAQLAQAVRQLLEHPAPPGRCVAVHAAKGGVGSTTVALALAWALAHRHGAAGDGAAGDGATEGGVVLVDFTTVGAGVRGVLEVAPPYDLGDVAARADRIDGAYLQSVLYPHPDGVALLASAVAPAEAPPLSSTAAARVLRLLRETHAFVVVDTDHHLADATLAALDAADRILLVTQLDIPTLRGTQQALALFARLGYPDGKVLLVGNRAGSRARLAQADAERALGRRLDVLLPNDFDRCATAMATGQFLQRGGRHHPLPVAVARLAAALADPPPSAPAGGAHAPVPPSAAPRSRLARLLARR